MFLIHLQKIHEVLLYVLAFVIIHTRERNVERTLIMGFPGVSDDKESACNAGDLGSIPGLGRSTGEGNGNPLQYSGLENSMGREA